MALANTVQPIAVLKMLPINTGLRPTLSERAPRNGLLRNAKNANAEKRRVIVKGDAPNDPT